MISLCLIVGTCCAALAQQTPDTVRVRLETSNGAEIGIDGDISSTNVLTKRVAVGSHKVVVRFGADIVKEYELNVTSEANQTYTYPIAGKVNVSTTPEAEVFIDGIRYGKSPVTAELLGDHNIRVEGDDMVYFPTTERVRVNPFENIDKQYTLTKRPPRLYGLVMGTWSPKAFGLFAGVCRSWGWYVNLATNGSVDTDMFDPEDGLRDNGSNGPGYYKKGDASYMCATTGLMKRCHKNVYAYAGAGYGEYAQGYRPVDGGSEIYPYGIKGVTVDLGVILKWKAILVSGGYRTILGDASPSDHKHNEFYLGLGFSIHKQKKDK